MGTVRDPLLTLERVFRGYPACNRFEPSLMGLSGQMEAADRFKDRAGRFKRPFVYPAAGSRDSPPRRRIYDRLGLGRANKAAPVIEVVPSERQLPVYPERSWVARVLL